MSLRSQQKCKWAERGRAGDPSRSSRTFGLKHWTKAPQEFLMWHQPITVLQLLKAQSQHQLPTHQLINTGMQNLPFVENVWSKTHGTPYLSIWIYQKVHAVPTSKKSHLEMLLLAYIALLGGFTPNKWPSGHHKRTLNRPCLVSFNNDVLSIWYTYGMF